MENWGYWILLAPVIIAALLYYLGFVSFGLGFITSAFKRGGSKKRMIFTILGMGLIATPFVYPKIHKHFAMQEAYERQAELAAMPRADITNRIPRRIIVMGEMADKEWAQLKRKYRLTRFPKDEEERLKQAYYRYMGTWRCHQTLGPDHTTIGKIKTCRDLPKSIQDALDVKEPFLILANGHATTYRQSNKIMGDAYELRLITKRDNLLIDYFEQRTYKHALTPSRMLSTGMKLDHTHEVPRKFEFIDAALRGT